MSISRTLRFEVFKRDGFRCAYCGKTPPEITLEIDHINPKSKKGKDEINNLISACFDCNRGKKNILLGTIPNTLSVNFEILKEKEIQIKQYNQFLKKIEKRLQFEMDEVNEVYHSYFPKWYLSEKFRNNSLKRFLNNLPKYSVIDFMHLACGRMIHSDINNPEDRAISYFCGICWNKIRKKESNGSD